jgi:hypothetical protein
MNVPQLGSWPFLPSKPKGDVMQRLTRYYRLEYIPAMKPAAIFPFNAARLDARLSILWYIPLQNNKF